MKHHIDALEAQIPQRDRSAASISNWTVGMQLHHALGATERIALVTAESEPGAETQKFNLARSVVLLSGRIPRGRGKAPKESLPPEAPTEEELRRLVEGARAAWTKLEAADPACWWKHFMFGVLRRDQVQRFIGIHNRHHLLIIEDILRASN